MSAAIPANPSVVTSVKRRIGTPDTHKSPAKINAKTETVPKSLPIYIRDIASAKPGAINIKTFA
ncbi:unannotated protein [freshwater metagenome]|uniref:Unannotated protein n=1 Tax=freshwater metagenome TaxID=449393 RepID=A0A6J6Z8C9_9ZZZZ